MGWNTVALILNDQCHQIERAPKTAAYMLSHPPIGNWATWDERGNNTRLNYEEAYAEKARDNNEPNIWVQTLTVYPTFHADHTMYLMAGGNTMDALNFVGCTNRNGKKCVVLELPERYQE